MTGPEKWHRRFMHQARWTESVRRFLFPHAGLQQADAVREVGCGSGAILQDLGQQTDARVVGIDLKLDYLVFAKNQAKTAELACADALCLPFKHETFSLTCCHFFLLWAQNPLQALLEMKRVTVPGGTILAMAEPDYGGRIDHPAALARLGMLQAQALARMGADTTMGRKLKGLFHQAGLRNVQAGVLGGQWSGAPAPEEWESEWDTLETDLAGEINPLEMAELKHLDAAAWRKWERMLFVPTFYAWGQV